MSSTSFRPSVCDWYSGKNILVTGGTGFVGKILIEKLLRTCPHLDCIYLLVRPKKSLQPQERLDDLLSLPIFDNIRRSNPNLFSKLICISGDLTSPQLGLSKNAATELCQKVNIVFHMAASVRFDQTLKEALMINTLSTYNVLKLAEEMNKLNAFVHVSTAYCQCMETKLEERIYESNVPPLKLLDLLKWADEDKVKSFTDKLIQGFPNTYSYTKSLTESIVASFSQKLPICIARPSIVTSALREPAMGWIDNMNGPTGLLVGAGKGVIRTMLCNPDYLADCIPVDLVVNGLILTAWETGTAKKSKAPLVVNLTMSDNAVTWGEIIENCRIVVNKYPFSVCLWYPGGNIKSSQLMHMISLVLFHYLPAYLIDFLLIIFRKKPFMIRTQTKIQNGLKMLQFYTVRPWKFDNDNWKTIYESLDDMEKLKFYSNSTKIDWLEYMANYILGIRHFCLKEEPHTLPDARRNMKKLYLLDKLVKIMFMILFLYTISKLIL